MSTSAYPDAESHLRDYLHRTARLLEGDTFDVVGAIDPELTAREAATTARLPLMILRDHLDRPALQLLVLAALPLIDPELGAELAARIAGVEPTAGELIDLLGFPGSARVLAADAPLVLLGLVELTGTESVPLAHRTVRVDPRVAAALRGGDTLDTRLRGIATLHRAAPAAFDRAGAAIVAHVAQLPGPIVVEGPAGVGKVTAVLAAAAASLRAAIVVDLDALGAEPVELLGLARREALLHDAWLVVRTVGWSESWPAPLRRELVELVETRAAIACLRDGDPLTRQLRGPRRVRIAMPTHVEQLQIWRTALGACFAVEDVCTRYPLPAGDIVAAAAAARASSEVAGRPLTVDDVVAAARARLGHRLGEVAELVTTTLTWDDLVLRPDVAARIREIIDADRCADRVMDRWGFGSKLPYGRALTALFSGGPGTGKTMAALLIGARLGLEVFRVDLSKIVSKYIGETERNLDRVFSEASRCRAMVLFDEADALFARRTEVKSSNDRHANLEVNFLLQRLEAHDGVVILTTNAATAIDPAFMRRLRYRIEFAAPDESERAALWRAMIPAAAPLAADVDFDALARCFNMSGGNIKNAVVRAAFLAASADLSALTHAVLMRAGQLEWTELGNLPEAEPASPAPVLRMIRPEPRAVRPEPVAAPEPAAEPSAPVAIAKDTEAVLLAIFARPTTSGTIEAAFRRKEQQLGEACAKLSPLEARNLQRRLSAPVAGDELAVQFGRLAPERRARLLGFLADARRREAFKVATPQPVAR